jgi:hypothetical protein
MNKSNIPVKDLNVPDGGYQKQITLTCDTPIYSSYTGKLVSHGGIPWGTISDAPSWNENYKKAFHVIEFNPANSSFMVHNYMGTFYW